MSEGCESEVKCSGVQWSAVESSAVEWSEVGEWSGVRSVRSVEWSEVGEVSGVE